jgi:hypothetical protein
LGDNRWFIAGLSLFRTASDHPERQFEGSESSALGFQLADSTPLPSMTKWLVAACQLACPLSHSLKIIN